MPRQRFGPRYHYVQRGTDADLIEPSRSIFHVDGIQFGLGNDLFRDAHEILEFY